MTPALLTIVKVNANNCVMCLTCSWDIVPTYTYNLSRKTHC